MSRSRRWCTAASTTAMAIAALVIAGPGCGRDEGGRQPAAPPAIPVAPEDVVRVERRAIRVGPRIAGTLEARVRADIRAEIGGRVLAVHRELGQPVKRGQLLVRIEAAAEADAARSAEAGVRSALENLNVAERQAERTQALVQAGAMAERDLETARSQAVAAEAQLRQARAQRASARTQLANTAVRAPMDGVVSEAPVHAGDVVAQGAPLFTIIDPSSMRLEASVPSEYLSSVSVGTPVAFTVHGYPGQKFQGNIERLAPAADPATRQIAMLVRIPNESGKLVAGLFAEGRVASEVRDAVVAPAAAVDRSGDTPTVTRVRGAAVERVAVELGVRDEASELVQVVSGLQPRDILLLRNARQLPPGTRVAISGQEAGRPPATAPPAAAPPTTAPSAAKPAETDRGR